MVFLLLLTSYKKKMEIKSVSSNEFQKLIPEFVSLHNSCFSHSLDERYFKWRYLENPYDDILAQIAIDDGKVIAFFAASPMIVVYKGVEYKAAVTLNAMTLKEYEGKGLFTRLGNELISKLEMKSYSVLIGFPGFTSNVVHCKKLQYNTVYEIPMMELNIANSTDEKFQMEFDNEFDLIYKDYNDINRIHIKKDTEYLKWRYKDSVENNYYNVVVTDKDVVKGFAICKTWRDRLNIVDISYSNETDLQILLNNCVVLGKEKKCNYVTCWAQINTDLHYVLEKKGFCMRYPVHYFNAKPLNGFNKFADVHDYRNWLIQMGDNNTY